MVQCTSLNHSLNHTHSQAPAIIDLPSPALSPCATLLVVIIRNSKSRVDLTKDKIRERET